MSLPLIVENTIAINAPAEKVWNLLVNPQQTKKYMFGCEATSDWAVGSPLLWKGVYEGSEMIFVKGNIVAIQPGKLLVYTVFDPNNTAIPDVPENYLTVTYALAEDNSITTLTVSQGDFATVAQGEKRYKETYNNGEGWNPILVQIKALAEAE
ncbi:MAG TPA: SRPBCC domain-containing protein [Chitinophagaceae bacterium]|jgi:uncharacterized protein YndB with AHSA1/START domain|nr:SRPBCC domain-containing protein [Chitinophagaceae bacterium]